MFLVEHVTDHFRPLILVVPCLMEAPWLPTVLNMLEDIPLALSYCKISHHGSFGRPGPQGFTIFAFNPVTAQR